MSLVRDFPLFPLGLVALPSELIPLHIFEDRYKTMIARCLDEESEFGIVWMADDGLRPVGCACEIAEVVERPRPPTTPPPRPPTRRTPTSSTKPQTAPPISRRSAP